MSRILKILLLVCCLVAGTTLVQAKGGVADITLHGTLIEPPPCTINDGNQVDVDFGDRVGINKIDGNNYRTPLSYQVTCENASSSTIGKLGLKLSLTGSSTSFDGEALVTNKDDLGIRIYRGDVPFTPNSSVTITLSNLPKLEAVPVKRAGAKLTEGTFEAWATLRADYE
ncbi:TPA: fimbrial protein [Serratia marcescens]